VAIDRKRQTAAQPRMAGTPTGSAPSTPRMALGELSNRADLLPCSPSKTPRQGPCSPSKTPLQCSPLKTPGSRRCGAQVFVHGEEVLPLPATMPLGVSLMQQGLAVPDDAQDLLDMDDLFFPELAAGQETGHKDAALLTPAVAKGKCPTSGAENEQGSILDRRMSEDLQCLSEMSPEALQGNVAKGDEIERLSPRAAPPEPRRRASGIKGPPRRSLTPMLDTPGSSSSTSMKPITPASSGLPTPRAGSSQRKVPLKVKGSDARPCPQESSAAPSARKPVPPLALHKVSLAPGEKPLGASPLRRGAMVIAPAKAVSKVHKLAVEEAQPTAIDANDEPSGAAAVVADGDGGCGTRDSQGIRGTADEEAKLPNCTLQSKLPRYTSIQTPRLATKPLDSQSTSKCVPPNSLQQDARATASSTAEASQGECCKEATAPSPVTACHAAAR